MAFNRLNEQEQAVILNKATEAPYTGRFYECKDDGVYKCKQCNEHLFLSSSKFDSGCGWPSFDDSIEGKVSQVLDADGVRVEIVCSNCKGHLGHLFRGEYMTSTNMRHCVNSISLNFDLWSNLNHKKAYFAGGCFWSIEKNFDNLQGVFSASSGYMGGNTKNPTYKEICTGDTGHLEVVEVHYDESIVSYKELVELFFKMIDVEQKDGQGVDIGSQYLSAIFTSDENEIAIIKDKINDFSKQGFKVATKILENDIFYKAEDYHQDYFRKKWS